MNLRIFVSVHEATLRWQIKDDDLLVDSGSVDSFEDIAVLQDQRRIQTVILEAHSRQQEAVEAAHYFGWKTASATTQGQADSHAALRASARKKLTPEECAAVGI